MPCIGVAERDGIGAAWSICLDWGSKAARKVTLAGKLGRPVHDGCHKVIVSYAIVRARGYAQRGGVDNVAVGEGREG